MAMPSRRIACFSLRYTPSSAADQSRLSSWPTGRTTPRSRSADLQPMC